MYFSRKILGLLIFSQNNTGAQTCDFRIMKYVYRKNNYNYYLINLLKSYKKIIHSLSVILTQADLSNIALVDVRVFSQSAAKQFCKITGIKGFFKNYYSGSFTSSKKFHTFKAAIIAEPNAETRVIHELKSTHMPIIAICNTDNSLRYVDFPIVLNTNSKFSSMVLYYVIAKIYAIFIKSRKINYKISFKDFALKKKNTKKYKKLRCRDLNPSLTGESRIS